MRNRILERLNTINEYGLWFTVKQNYGFQYVKRMIGLINKYSKENVNESFENFVKRNSTNKSEENFRNARVLMNLNILENDFSKDAEIKYKDYQIAKSVINSYYDNDYELRNAITNRMLAKNYISVSKSNKASLVSNSERTLYISPYKIFF